MCFLLWLWSFRKLSSLHRILACIYLPVVETSQSIRLVLRESPLLHHSWKGFGGPRVSARHLFGDQLHCSIPPHLQISLAMHCTGMLKWGSSLWVWREDVRKYREYREHPLDSRAFFCDECVPSGKVDEDRVSRVRLQQSADYMVVFQPVLSEQIVSDVLLL